MTTSLTVKCTWCNTRSTVEFDANDKRMTVLECCGPRRSAEHYRLQRNAARGTAKLLLDFAIEIYKTDNWTTKFRQDIEEDLDAFQRQVQDW